MLSDLLRPFSYLTIRHESYAPLVVNWVVPLTLTCLVTGGACFAGLSIDVFSGNGVVSRLLGFLQSLPGFYIAALAAIATFNNPDMLKIMPGKPPRGRVSHNGGSQVVDFTRRRFLSSMFAYLTALSIGLTFLAIVFLAVAEPVKNMLPASLHGGAKLVAWMVFLTFVTQMASVTLWGLFYLGDRIHTPDSLPAPGQSGQNSQPPLP